ncbi:MULTISPECIES: PfkB family carbohydrate kinase [unclassified Crossiella]|uniref:PfkB family carbohydrate kinase n=1 Tax=unclassified Crossiella TaxID=2620835 RepID=UPI001FFF9FEA|nr:MULTISPECIES: PfkB family carbohydrate kinase [unclassified Crossiella]MCK2239794.1 PfkB family carbohydrate kinase [Crossiella sp. S99.2]MCK2252489.1 PfkB family carbohydrate kinase [Crossiella sp. S99.1]
MSGQLVHTGQVVVDLVLSVSGLPPLGGDVLASAVKLTPGGGFNVMAAACRSGAEVLYAGSHGTGSFGDLARAAMAAEGVLVANPPTPGADTGIVVALVDEETGERTFVTGVGAEGRLEPGQLDRVHPSAADMVYISGYSLLQRANREALLGWLARLPGPTVLFDPGPLVEQIVWSDLTAVLSRVDILSCNAREAKQLSRTNTTRAAAAALATLVPSFATVIVRDGPAGCLLQRDGRITTVAGFNVDAVDTNGAGDAHCGALLAELLRGSGMLEATRYANAAAAIAVTRHGPATAPVRADIEELVGTGFPP